MNCRSCNTDTRKKDMADRTSAIVRYQTDILLRNLEQALDIVTEARLEKTIFRWPLWKQYYHLLHSLDQWFINAFDYREPPFHKAGMNGFDVMGDGRLTKSQLVEYFNFIRARIEKYVDSLTTDALFENLGTATPVAAHFGIAQPLTRLDLIIGQMRHAMYNLGLIHAMLYVDTKELPAYIGMSDAVPANDK